MNAMRNIHFVVEFHNKLIQFQFRNLTLFNLIIELDFEHKAEIHNKSR